MGKLTIIELNYHCHDTVSVAEVVQLHWPSSGYLHLLKEKADVQFVKHLQQSTAQTIDGVPYLFFKRRNRFWQIPFATHRYIKQQKPDVVLVQGLVFPLQVIALKWLLGKRTLLIAQHHGEKPPTGWGAGIKGWLQRRADTCIAAYTFTALGNAEPWLEAKIIARADKCVEVLEAAPTIEKLDKTLSQQQTVIKGSPSFLWVGRLNHNKDPLTVLMAFSDYLLQNPAARLYMIYNQTDAQLMNLIKQMLQVNAKLGAAVQLVGEVAKAEMAQWYSAADYYVSASHREGSGYALLEAMHCGCIPVVTDIPTFSKITDGGKLGFLYPPSNPNNLLQVLLGLEGVDKKNLSAAVLIHAQEKLSHEAIAGEMVGLVERLKGKLF
jgi:glycosyltransferase involved in cell wall biosynthesis